VLLQAAEQAWGDQAESPLHRAFDSYAPFAGREGGQKMRCERYRGLERRGVSILDTTNALAMHQRRTGCSENPAWLMSLLRDP
jgi:hypothetical protein